MRRSWRKLALGLAFGWYISGDRARADPQPIATPLTIEQPSFVPVAGIGYYNPFSSPVQGGLQYTLGLRFVRPELSDLHQFAHAYQLSISYLSDSAETIYNYRLDFMQYLPRTDLFRVDHHFFFGIGMEAADVKKPFMSDVFDPGLAFIGGFQAQVSQDIQLETTLRYFNTFWRHNYDAGGIEPSISINYGFDPQ